MIVTTLVAAATALAPLYTGTTEEGKAIRVHASDRVIHRVTTAVVDYECRRFGQIGPIRVRVDTRAPVDRRGRFSFVEGERVERVGVAGTVRGDGTITGRVRVSGTIGTGERCSSPVIRFRARALTKTPAATAPPCTRPTTSDLRRPGRARSAGAFTRGRRRCARNDIETRRRKQDADCARTGLTTACLSTVAFSRAE